jgi:dihydrofolate reductase
MAMWRTKTAAAQAIKAELVDECHLFVAPIVVDGGKQSLPNNVRLELELLDERWFGNSVVHPPLPHQDMRRRRRCRRSLARRGERGTARVRQPVHIRAFRH